MAVFTVWYLGEEVLQFEMDPIQAAAPIYIIDSDGEREATPFQTADGLSVVGPVY